MHNAIDKIAQCSDLPARRPADKRYLPMRNGIPNLSALQAFEASARLGSFSRAAEELALTHSAVYRQVASLEARLCVQLFTRVRRRIVLTEHGAEYAGRPEEHTSELQSLMRR